MNPTQFGPGEDFARYPRNEARDLELLEAAGVAAVLLPPVEEMYPEGDTTRVHVDALADVLEGARRPGHFVGVATVVSKLFHIVRPDRAYFGQKDAQQLAVIRRMTRDLLLPIEVVGCRLAGPAPVIGLVRVPRAGAGPKLLARGAHLPAALKSLRDFMDGGGNSFV